MKTLVVITLICVVFVMILEARAEQVFDYRVDIANKMLQVSSQDIADEINPTWRFTEFNKVSQRAMIFEIWRSFDSFYPNKDFLKPNK